MPIIRTYVVTREQQVKVRAENPVEAVDKANEVFAGIKDDRAGAYHIAEVKDLSVSARLTEL